jgi:hypothetical protein
MLRSGAGVVEVIILQVTATISPHQLIIQLLDARLKAGILLKKLSVALLNVLDDAVLGLHLAGALLQAEAQVSAHRCDLLKQGAHVLGVACRELWVADGGHALTPHRVSLIPNGEQGDSGVAKDRQVVLTELHEGMMGSPLQSVVKVIITSHDKPSHHGRVSGVSQNVHVDLAAPQPKLMVRAAMVRGKPCVAKMVQHVLEQGGKLGAVQPIAT